MDLGYMDHLAARRLVNLPRVMMRHMSYVISIKDHELPYGDWLTMVFEAFGVPLVNKKGEEPKRYDYFEETFLTMWNKDDFGREAVIDEAAVEGESGSGEKFYDAEDEARGSRKRMMRFSEATPSSARRKDKDIARVDPSGPSSRKLNLRSSERI
ncbi:hypothetical protein Dimus_035395 [Dionaea muscipula]